MAKSRRLGEHENLFIAHAVKATAPLPGAGPILVAVFSSTDTSFDEKPITAKVIATTSTSSVPATITKEGDLLQVFINNPFTSPGTFEINVSIWQGKTQLQEITSAVITGDFSQRFAARLASDVAGEHADDELCAYAHRLLVMGATHADVINELMSCAQSRKRKVFDAYKQYFKRSPGAKESKVMTDLVAEENGDAKLATALLASKEYFQKQGKNSNAGFVKALVKDLTGDERLPPQAAEWLDALDNKTKTVDAVVTAVMNTLPARLYAASTLFEQLYHRRPGISELGNRDTGAVVFFQPQSPEEDATLPDYTYQFFVNLEQAEIFAGGQLVRQLMIDTVKQLKNGLGQFSLLIPDSSGVDSISWNGQENGGLWIADVANETALQTFPPLSIGTFFSFTLKEKALLSMLDLIWQLVPKRLNGAGKPDDNGNIDLDNHELSLEDNQLRVTVHATYHATSAIAVGAKANYYAEFNVSNGDIVSQGSHNLTYDAGIDWIAALSAGAFLGLPMIFAWPSLDTAGVHEPNAPDFSFGDVIHNLFPKKVLIPQSKSKIVFRYNSVEVIPGEGIVASGIDFPFALREPAANLGSDVDVYYPDSLAHPRYELLPSPGPNLIKLRFTFFVVTDDMRDPLTINWTTDGVKTDQSGHSIKITWQFNQHTPSNRFVQVSVTDADGLLAMSGITIRYLAKERTAPAADDSLPNRIPFRANNS